MNIKINISCCLCPNNYEGEVSIPVDFTNAFLETEEALCKSHADITDFIDNQCAGCVEGWHDCALWRNFAYGEKKLDEQDFSKMRQGFCPRRTNGTGCFTPGKGFERIDISSVAVKGGIALEKAIKDYWERHDE